VLLKKANKINEIVKSNRAFLKQKPLLSKTPD